MSVAFNNHNTDVQASSASSFSSSMTVNTGSSLAAVVRVEIVAGSSAGTPTITSPTFNSVALTAAGALQADGLTPVGGIQLFALPAPTTGSHTLAFGTTLGPYQTIYADLTSYTGADQTTPIRAGSFQGKTQTSSASTVSLTIATQAGDMTTTCAGDLSESVSINSTNQTQRSLDNGGAADYGTDDNGTAAVGSTVTHTWTFGGNSTCLVMAGFSIAAAGGGGDTLTGQAIL